MVMSKRRILNSPAAGDDADAAGDTKRKMESIFDQSLAVLCSGEINSVEVSDNALAKASAIASGKRTKRTSTATSYSNSLPIHIDRLSLQRRALVDAAKALATLWKVPETRGSRIHSRGLQLSRETS